MNLKFRKALEISILTVAFLVLVGSTHAYVLQGPHILDLMIEKLGEAQSLFVTQKLIFYHIEPAVESLQSAANGDSGHTDDVANRPPAVQDLEAARASDPQETLELEESLRFVFSQAFRSELRSPESERIHIFDGHQALTIIDGNIVAASANRFDLYKDLLLYRSREALTERLLKLGVNVFVSSLGRFEEKIVFIIGANYPDDSVTQIWIDQETFLPIRWIFRGANGVTGSDTLEVRYLMWWKIGKIRYPSRIEFYQDTSLVRVSQAKNFEGNAVFSKELFDIEHLKQVYPRALAQPIVPGEAEEPSEVQKTIEEFKRVFE